MVTGSELWVHFLQDFENSPPGAGGDRFAIGFFDSCFQFNSVSHGFTIWQIEQYIATGDDCADVRKPKNPRKPRADAPSSSSSWLHY